MLAALRSRLSPRIAASAFRSSLVSSHVIASFPRASVQLLSLSPPLSSPAAAPIAVRHLRTAHSRMARRYRRGAEPNEDGWLEGDIDLVLRVDGVTGSCTRPGFEGWIEVMSCSHHVSRQVSQSERPLRIRQAAALRKKRAFIAAGLDQNGCPLPVPETEPKKAADGTIIPPTAAELEARISQEDFDLQREAALAKYESGADLEFREDETPSRKLERPGISEFQLSKFTDIASPQLMALLLGQKQGVGVQIAFLQARAKKVETVETGSSSTAHPKREDTATSIFELARQEEEEEAPKEYVMYQEYQLYDAFLSNLSMSGGSGGRPVETIYFVFGSYQYRFIDLQEKRAPGVKHVTERSMTYDHLRHVVRSSAESVAIESEKNDRR